VTAGKDQCEPIVVALHRFIERRSGISFAALRLIDQFLLFFGARLFATHGIEIPRPQRVVLARDPEPDPFAPGGPASPAPTQDDLSAGTD
jgi:hypothetical protein